MKIILGTFKENVDELSEFLEPRVGTKPTIDGGELTIDDESAKQLRARHVKTYIKRFLYKKGERKRYRVLVDGGELTLIELEGAEGGEEKKGEEKEKEKKVSERQGPNETPEPGPSEGSATAPGPSQ